MVSIVCKVIKQHDNYSKGQTELLLPALRLAAIDCGLTKPFSLTTAIRGGGPPPGTTVAHDGNSLLQLIVA